MRALDATERWDGAASSAAACARSAGTGIAPGTVARARSPKTRSGGAASSTADTSRHTGAEGARVVSSPRVYDTPGAYREPVDPSARQATGARAAPPPGSAPPDAARREEAPAEREARARRGASSTNNHQEVQVHTRGPSEGTRSRGDKGPRATEGLVEVVGTGPFRAKAKRRKASASGELALSSKAQNPSVAQAYWRRDGLKMVVLTWRDLLGPGREAGTREDEEDGRG
jgi:hypothetical protein